MPSKFGAEWHHLDKAGRYLQRGKGSSNPASVVTSLRSRLQHTRTPWYEVDDAGYPSPAEQLQVAVHVRRGDLCRHRLESDQGRWVPDEYYEEVLPRLFKALATAAPVVAHVFS